MSTNVSHFTKHVNKMIQAMGTPEASVASLWETLTSSPWWKTILIEIILTVLFLLFASCICNCVAGFVSSRMKGFKLQTVAQTPAYCSSFLQLLLGAPRSESLSMRVRKICCLTNLGTIPLVSSEAVMEWEWCPFSLGNMILLKKRGEWEHNRQEGQGSPNGVNSLQVSDIFISLKWQEETNMIFFSSLYKFKRRFLLKYCVPIMTLGFTWS